MNFTFAAGLAEPEPAVSLQRDDPREEVPGPCHRRDVRGPRCQEALLEAEGEAVDHPHGHRRLINGVGGRVEKRRPPRPVRIRQRHQVGRVLLKERGIGGAVRVARAVADGRDENLIFTGLTHNFPVDPAV